VAERDQGVDPLEYVSKGAYLGREGGREGEGEGGRNDLGCSPGWWVFLLVSSRKGVEWEEGREGGRAGGMERACFPII